MIGCGGSSGDSDTITAWTLENQPDRIAAQEKIMRRFTKKSGVKVEVRGIDENQLRTLITSAAAGGSLPDAILALPLAYVQRLANEQISDPALANEVVEKLGRETFAKRALELASVDGEAKAVPSDAWGQIIFYRKDLFEKAGLEPPNSLAALRTAAKRLDSPEVAGIAMSTTPNDTFTQESFESFALANGCQLTDKADKITLNTPECQGALKTYADLAKNYSVTGNQDVDTTRATYFAGKSAMVVWSSFLLDELAGLRKDAMPTCPECRGNPEYLSKNTGIVTSLKGDGGTASEYGDEATFAIMADANSKTKDLVEYLMIEGYMDWIAQAPEGKIPVRLGTKDEPRKYINEWSKLETGVDSKKALDKIYSPEVIEQVRAAAEEFDRWGFGHSDKGGLLVGTALGELPVTTAVSEVISNGGDPTEELQKAQDSYQQLQDKLR